MILPFSQFWKKDMDELSGQKNYFVEKILKGLPDNDKDFYPEICSHCGWKGMSSIHLSGRCSKCGYFSLRYYHEFPPLGDNGYYTHLNVSPKLHTIRHDPHNRWKPGMKIHPRINNRTKNSFQFAPTLECVSVQKVEIKAYKSTIKPMLHHSLFLFPEEHLYQCFKVCIDGKSMSLYDVNQLALNDGFPSVEAFFRWFNEDTKPGTVIVHWTDKTY